MKRLLVAGLATLTLLVGCTTSAASGRDDPPPGERMGKAVGEAVEKGQ